MPSQEWLFKKGSLSATLNGHFEEMKSRIEGYREDDILNANEAALADYFEGEFQIWPLVLDVENAVIDKREVSIDMSGRGHFLGEASEAKGTEYYLEVPFAGDPKLFELQASQSSSMRPRGRIFNQTLTISFADRNPTAEVVRTRLDNQLQLIRDYIGYQEEELGRFNSGIRERATQLISNRRKKVLGDKNLLSELGFKMRERGQPNTYTVPTVRKEIRAPRPQPSSKPFKPEPSLDDVQYEQILDLLSSMAKTMEYSPKCFSTLDEETLRSHFLVALNAQYEGGATGETFHGAGKTDILIQHEGKNIFVAECKFWKGPKSLLTAVDQLQSYSCWRDTKVALIIFNRNRDFTRVLKSIDETMREHESYRRPLKSERETSFRYQFAHAEDSNREMTITVLAFEVPTP